MIQSDQWNESEVVWVHFVPSSTFEKVRSTSTREFRSNERLWKIVLITFARHLTVFIEELKSNNFRYFQLEMIFVYVLLRKFWPNEDFNVKRLEILWRKIRCWMKMNQWLIINNVFFLMQVELQVDTAWREKKSSKD